MLKLKAISALSAKFSLPLAFRSQTCLAVKNTYNCLATERCSQLSAEVLKPVGVNIFQNPVSGFLRTHYKFKVKVYSEIFFCFRAYFDRFKYKLFSVTQQL